MKKLLYLLVGILLAAFILPSCNSALSITKRKYTRGYYVHHNAGKQRGESTAAVSKSQAAAKSENVEVRATEIARQATLKNEEPAAPQKMVTAAASKKHEA